MEKRLSLKIIIAGTNVIMVPFLYPYLLLYYRYCIVYKEFQSMVKTYTYVFSYIVVFQNSFVEVLQYILYIYIFS